MKKGQGLSINTIIIAALGVLVLLILVAVFSGGMGRTNQQLRSATEAQQLIRNTLAASGVDFATFEKEVKDACKDPTKKEECYNNITSVLIKNAVSSINVYVGDSSGIYPTADETQLEQRCLKIPISTSSAVYLCTG